MLCPISSWILAAFSIVSMLSVLNRTRISEAENPTSRCFLVSFFRSLDKPFRESGFPEELVNSFSCVVTDFNIGTNIERALLGALPIFITVSPLNLAVL